MVTVVTVRDCRTLPHFNLGFPNLLLIRTILYDNIILGYQNRQGVYLGSLRVFSMGQLLPIRCNIEGEQGQVITVSKEPTASSRGSAMLQ